MLELDGDPRAQGEGLGIVHTDRSGKVVIIRVILPGGGVISEPIDISSRDLDGVGVVASDRHGARDRLDPRGVHPDGIAPIVGDRAVADGRGAVLTVTIEAVARIIMDSAAGDLGAGIIATVDSIGGTVGHGRIGDRDVVPCTITIEASLIPIPPVRKIAVIETASGVGVAELEIAPVPGGRGSLIRSEGDVLAGGPFGHEGAVDIEVQGVGAELDGDPWVQCEGLGIRDADTAGKDVRDQVVEPEGCVIAAAVDT